MSGVTVQHFFDPVTSTLTYVASDNESGHCVVIDPVLDLDYASGTITTHSVDQLIDYIEAEDLTLELILETHIHADHLSSAATIVTARRQNWRLA